ncbi:MAG: DUF3656 domain-containing protein [Lachnospiraceae bacterium]|nr:DUF3656 domain-containing protein [Lachnospiraceae bacterium]
MQPAQKQPLSTENIVRQLQKLGGTSFNAGGIEVNSDEDIFYPIGGINDLRRSAAEALERKIIEDNGFPFEREAVNKECHVHDGQEAALEEKTDCFCAVSVRTLEQLGAAVKFVFYKRLYIDADIFVSNPQSVSNLCIALRSAGKSVEREFFISLPYVIRRKDEAFLARLKELMEEYSELFSGIQVRGLDGLGYLLENKYEGVIYADAGLYIWNKRALSELKPYIDGFCIPYELKLSEQRSICAELEREKVIYGRLPMMITANCVINTVFNCMKGQNKTAFLTDRYGKVFPVVSECTHCMNIIYNSVPVSLHTKPDRLYDRTDFRIDFTVESASDTESILKYFMMLLKGDFFAVPPYQEYTTGHDRRGVE